MSGQLFTGGASQDIDSYVQKSDRARRDGIHSSAIIYFKPADKLHTAKAIVQMPLSVELWLDDASLTSQSQSSKSCDICKRKCDCLSCKS